MRSTPNVADWAAERGVRRLEGGRRWSFRDCHKLPGVVPSEQFTKAAEVEEAPGSPSVMIPGGKLGDIHRIGGASVENLRLKPREAALDVPGISVIKAPTPGAAAREIRSGLPRAKGLHQQAKTIGTTSTEAVRSVGFDIIPTPSTALPHPHRIIHPQAA